MIPHGVEVFVGLEPIDLRWGFDRLAGLVTERLGRDARSRALFVFFGKRRDALKYVSSMARDCVCSTGASRTGRAIGTSSSLRSTGSRLALDSICSSVTPRRIPS